MTRRTFSASLLAAALLPAVASAGGAALSLEAEAAPHPEDPSVLLVHIYLRNDGNEGVEVRRGAGVQLEAKAGKKALDTTLSEVYSRHERMSRRGPRRFTRVPPERRILVRSGQITVPRGVSIDRIVVTATAEVAGQKLAADVTHKAKLDGLLGT